MIDIWFPSEKCLEFKALQDKLLKTPTFFLIVCSELGTPELVLEKQIRPSSPANISYIIRQDTMMVDSLIDRQLEMKKNEVFKPIGNPFGEEKDEF